MATFFERLELIVDANVAGAVKGLGLTSTQATTLDSKARKLGGALPLIAAGAAVGAAGLYASLQAYSESERANLKLQNSLKNNPLLAGASADAFLKQAAAIQKVTVASDESVVEAQAMLGTFRLTQSQIMALTPLVVDYARKFDTDLVTASKQVGKAMDGQVGALKRNGVTIDETAFKADRFKAVLEALRGQVGGFAEGEANTAAGKIAQLKNTVNDLMEIVGEGVAPAFGVFADALKETVGFVNDLTGPIGGLASVVKGYFMAIVSPAKFAADGLNLLIGDDSQENIKKTAQFYEGASGVFGAFGQQVAASAQSSRDHEQATTSNTASIQAQVSALQNAASALATKTGLELAATGSLLGVESAQRGVNDAIQKYGPGSLEARTAQNQLEVATLKAADANRNNMMALVGLRDQVPSLRFEIQAYIDALNRIPRDVRTIINAEQRGSILGFGAFHAAGGVFTKAHVGVVAEAGPEAIIPLNNPGRAAQVMSDAGLINALSVSGKGGGTAVSITVNAPVGADYAAAGREIQSALDAYYQRRGRNN